MAIQILNLAKPYDNFSFLVANNSSYGSKLFYQNDSLMDNPNRIIFNTPVTFNSLEIRLLNCDL